MVLCVDLFEPVAGDVGVDLGCRDIGMAQHRLDGAQVRASLDKMRREGMAQRVG